LGKISTLKDEPLSSVLHAMSAAEIWMKLSECYEGKGKQTIAYLIGELFHGTLSDKSSMEMHLNSMHQKSYVFKSLGQPLNDTLVAVAMVISLPSSYSILQTILMSSSDKLSVNTVILQVLAEEKSCLTEKPKSDQKDKKKKKCPYCLRSGHHM
jgi:hypothetical protein